MERSKEKKQRVSKLKGGYTLEYGLFEFGYNGLGLV